MSLISLTYSEYPGDSRFWELETASFSSINLIVGKNATGKSRLLNVLGGLCRLLSGTAQVNYESGLWGAEILLSGKLYSIEIVFNNNKIESEVLKIDGVRKLNRGADGMGEIYYEQQNAFIKFQVPHFILAIQQKQDELQHPFISELSAWARQTQFFSFNTSFISNTFVAWSALSNHLEGAAGSSMNTDVVSAYSSAFKRFGMDFDAAILTDMEEIGYSLSDVGVDDMRSLVPGIAAHEPILGLFVKERDRENAILAQSMMSTGMFRAVALIIFANIAKFSRTNTLMSVDDIGEGLDFDRAVRLIDVLMRIMRESSLQLFLTSNDRFVMNNVELEYWTILRRAGAVVRPYNYENSKRAFDEFKFIGLNNFDFFSSSEFL